MPRRKSSEPYHKATILFYKSDVERLQEWYPEHGYQAAARAIIRAHVTSREQTLAKARQPLLEQIALSEEDINFEE